MLVGFNNKKEIRFLYIWRTDLIFLSEILEIWDKRVWYSLLPRRLSNWNPAAKQNRSRGWASMCHTSEGGDGGMKYIFENLQFSIFKCFQKLHLKQNRYKLDGYSGSLVTVLVLNVKIRKLSWLSIQSPTLCTVPDIQQQRQKRGRKWRNFPATTILMHFLSMQRQYLTNRGKFEHRI